MKSTIAVLFFLVSIIGMAQEQLNDYKYIIVPKKFDGFKRENQHQTSTLVKYLFTEKGFLTVYEDALPDELNNNRCLGLLANLVDGSSLFTTKAAVTLKDCNGQEVFATKQGKSKEKDYKTSYGEALRESFTSFDAVNYSYNGKAENSAPVTASFKNDVKKLDGEDTQSKNTKSPMVEQEATIENQSYKDRRPVQSDYKKAEPKNKMVKQEATTEQQSYKDRTPTPSDFKKAESKDVPTSVSFDKSSRGILYAQELANGFQLVDSAPKIHMKIYKSSVPNFYLAEAEGKNGVVYENGGKWFFEYYSNENLITEELNIKF